uniref:DOT1 domain-containing protein n=1 Tax=Corethron hystrix TaxID=216773 RepID=A0A7S1FSM1_9STRA|mmetsp:Transcript_25809/g.59418  ORF Transcript_25809/g.59418 Transcript_25809/m.59418 type:complete len:389 (+) Transcript_25809:79-1245(+)
MVVNALSRRGGQEAVKFSEECDKENRDGRSRRKYGPSTPNLINKFKNMNVRSDPPYTSSPQKRKTKMTSPIDSSKVGVPHTINFSDNEIDPSPPSTPSRTRTPGRTVLSAIITPPSPKNRLDDDNIKVLPRSLKFDQSPAIIPASDPSSPTEINPHAPFLCPIPPVPKSVKAMYKEIRLRTGAIGGNASGGPIYGELSVGSMHRMVHLMRQHADLGPDSLFIDVGSGLGKPNIHVAADPGCYLSVGIEVEKDRYLLGMHNLRGVLNRRSGGFEDTKFPRCTYVLGDIFDAKTFSPFTHVYMFSIGFPPYLWSNLAEKFNSSDSPWLICYHPPRHIIKKYAFNVELVVQMTTSMHGSSEGHMAYIYRRCQPQTVSSGTARKGKRITKKK